VSKDGKKALLDRLVKVGVKTDHLPDIGYTTPYRPPGPVKPPGKGVYDVEKLLEQRQSVRGVVEANGAGPSTNGSGRADPGAETHEEGADTTS
jgi:hypothetical protein